MTLDPLDRFAARDVDVVDYSYFFECAAGVGSIPEFPCLLHFNVDNNGLIELRDFAAFQNAATPTVP